MSLVGSEIKKQLNVKTTVQPGTGLPNLIALSRGEVDMAMTYTVWASEYIKGCDKELGFDPADPSKVATSSGSASLTTSAYHCIQRRTCRHIC